MDTKRLATRTALACAVMAVFLSACSGSSGPSAGVPQIQQGTSGQQQRLSPRQRILASEKMMSPPKQSGSSNCILIDSVYRYSDFQTLGYTAAAVSGGDHLNINATGCDYGIYLYPGAPNLNVDHAKVKGAFRAGIFAEDVTGVTIDHTVVNGTSFGTADANSSSSASGKQRSFSGGGIEFRGASGTVSDTRISNVQTFGMNILYSNACFVSIPPKTCMVSNVTADHVVIDNSTTMADGFDILGAFYPTPFSTAVITHSKVIGANLSTLSKTSEIDNVGAQTGVASIDGNVTLNDVTTHNMQVGFDLYCSNSNVNSLTDLENNHDKVLTGTTVALPQTPLPASQTLNVFTVQQMDGAFGAGYC